MQPARQGGVQRCQRVGLGEEAVHPGVQAKLFVALHGVGRQRHDGQVGATALRKIADRCGGLVAVHHRHLAIHQHEVEISGAHPVDGLRTIAGHLVLQTELGQHRLGHTLVDGVVFDQQHQALQGAEQRIGQRSRRGVDQDSAQHAGDRIQQVGASHRLVQVTQNAGLCAGVWICADVGRTQHDQPGAQQRRLSLDVAGEFQAVHARHVHVQHGQVERATFAHRVGHRPQCLCATFDAVHPHVPSLQLL